MGASLLVLLIAAIILLGNAHPATFQCSRYCKEDWSKFGYEIGSSYQYIYSGVVKTTVNATGRDTQSGFLFKTQVKISVLSTCDYVMELENVKFDEVYTNKNAIITNSPEQRLDLERSLTRHVLYFSFQNGRIETICPEEEEDQNILNIKKAILSAFQNSMPNFEKDAVVYENDISGNCETRYQIENYDSNLVIRKIKNLEACSHRKSRYLSWLSVPYSQNSARNSLSILRSKQICTQKYNEDLILENSQCSEEHLFQPFSNGDHGALTYLTQNLELVAKTKNANNPELPKSFYYENLLSNYRSSEDDKNKELSSVISILEKLKSRTTDGVEPDVPRLFSELVHQLQNLDHDTMIVAFELVKSSPKQKKFLLDAMPLITSIDAIKTMKILYDNGELTDAQINSWLGTLIFLPNVSLPVIDSIKSLMESEKSIKQKAILTGSTLVYMYCREDPRCLEKPAVKEIIKIIEEPLTSSCVPSSPDNYNEILLALKGIGNIGLTDSLWYLKSCYSNADSPLELRLAAIAAHRRISCAENENLEQFQDYFANIRESTEIRIASYLASMQCASYATFARVKDVLRTEETNQVGSFVWTHLTNLQESSSQWKRTLKSLVENEFLRNKFSTDMRKYSRNYEVSTFFDSLNTGVTMESNVVFSSDSYLPKSAMLNFSLDLFGEAVNIFEVGARIEGFEQIVENLFGPEGYFPEESIRNVLKSVRNKENQPQDKIQKLRDSFTSQTTIKEPAGLLYAKIFGNEISYTRFKDLEGLVGGPINGRSILDALMKLFRQQDVDYTKSFVFIDSSYKVPTMLGFPLTLDINGTATVGLTVKSKIDLKDLWAHKISVEGKIYPSVAVEIIGTMTVDSFISKTGLRSINKLNSNTYLDGHAFINKGKLVDLKLNVPKQQMDIINIESQVYVVLGESAYPMDDVTDNVEDWQGCTQKLFNTITGLELCYAVRYVNASQSRNAPYFPLTGGFKYSMDVKKVDTFDSYQLSLRTHTEMKNYRPIYFMSFYLDTPNSTIDRKIKTSYLLDCDKLSLNATLVSPSVNLEVNSRIGDDFDNLGFLLQTKLNNNEILLANMTLKSAKIGDTWKYHPLAELKYKAKTIAALSGNVNYLQGTKYSANLKLDGVSNDPITVSGDLHLGSKRFKLVSSIKSKSLSGNAHAVVIKRPESIAITTKVTYDYKKYKKQILDFEFKQHTIMKRSVSEESLYLSMNSTQKPLYNTLLSFNVLRDKLYFETKGLALLFNTTWQTHQLLKYEKSNDNNEVILKCSFGCVEKNIDYNIELAYIKSENIFKVHGLLQLTKSKRLEALVNYNIIPDKNRTLDLLLYYPKQAWMVNGVLYQQNQKQFNILIQSFYEIEDEKRCMLVLSGEYTNSTIVNYQNHTITGSIEIPETNGRFNTPWMISSTLQISPDLFLNTIQLKTTNDFYISHVTWTENSFSGLLQINDKQLLTGSGLQTEEELSMSFGLNIYQHFEVTAKLLMPYRKLDFLLYWDKDRDINQKISFMINRQVTKGLYFVDLEYPNQKVTASFILLPTQVTMNVTWGIDSFQRIYLKAGNKVYDIGGIWFAKLETPFIYLENQEFKMSYYILPQNAELKIDVSWRDQKINFIMSGLKSPHHLSGYLVVNTTIEEISKLRVAVSHTHNNTNGLLKIKNDATFVFNDHQVTGQCLWESKGTNISSNFKIVSSSNTIAPIIGMLLVNNNQSSNHLSSFIGWRDKKISVDYKFQNSHSYIKIKTPFKSLEETELDYALIGEPDKLILEVKVNVLKQYNYALISWNNEGHANMVEFQLTCPLLGTYKIMFKHSTRFGHLDEFLVITQGHNDILEVKLYGDIIPILMMDVTASVRLLEHKSTLAIKNSLDPIASTVEIKWDKNYIMSILKIVFEDNDLSDFYWNLGSSALSENITCKYYHKENSYTLGIALPKGYKLNNVLTLENSYKSIKNTLNVNTPSRSGSIYYTHNLTWDNCNFDHQVVFRMNNNESKFALNYNINKDINFLDAASIKLMTPWQYPIVLDFSMPQENEYTWKPSLQLEYGNEKVIKLESALKIYPERVSANIAFNSPYMTSFNIDGEYDFAKRVRILKIFANNKHESFDVICKFYLERLEGMFTLNATKEKDILTTYLDYNLNNPLKTVTLKINLPEKQDRFEIEASMILEEYTFKGNALLLSSISQWEKASLDILLGLTQDESYVVFERNDKSLIGKYSFKKFIVNGDIFIDGKLMLISNFETVKNCSLEVTYKSSDKQQDVGLTVVMGDFKAGFGGNYQLTNQVNKGTQIISLDGGLKLEYYRSVNNKRLDQFDIDANMKGSIEIKKMSGKVNALLVSNIPSFRKLDINANYELYKKGYKIKADMIYNDDDYNLEHYFQPLSNKIEFSTSLYTPPLVYGKIIGKLHLSRYDDTLQTEFLIDRNSQIYNLTVTTRYDAFLSSDTIIKVFTPDSQFKAGIKTNFTLTESRIKLYSIINEQKNEVEFFIKTRNYKRGELQLYADLITFDLSPWTVNAKYDFSPVKKSLSFQLNDKKGTGLEINLDKQNLHVNVNTATRKDYLIISGNHNIDNFNDFLFSYALYFNDQKIKIDLTHKVNDNRIIRLDVLTTLKDWNKIHFSSVTEKDGLALLADFKNHLIAITIDKSALFNNRELLSVKFNKMPIILIWSGSNKSYLTSITQWGNYKFLVSHPIEPTMYSFSILRDGREVASILVENIHIEEYFDFTIKIKNSIFLDYSDLTAYFYTDYNIPNEFKFYLHRRSENILGVSYNFQLEENRYLAVFNLNSNLEILQSFSISFILDPQFLLECDVLKRAYNVESLYKLTMDLPFHSNEYQLEFNFPWKDNQLAFTLQLQLSQIYFQLKTPIKEWENILLEANYKKNDDFVSGLLRLQKNDAFLTGEWSYGYSEGSPFINIDIKNKFLKERHKTDKIIINGRYDSGKQFLFNCDIDEFENKILMDYDINNDKASLLTEMIVPELFITNAIFNISSEYLSNINVILEANNYKLLNISAIYGLDTNQEVFVNAFIDILENLYQYDFNFKYDFSNLGSSTIVLKSKTYNYLLNLDSNIQIDFLTIRGIINFKLDRGKEFEDLSSDTYKITWNGEHNSVTINLQKNYDITTLSLTHFFKNDKLKSKLIIACNNKTLSTEVEGILNSEVASGSLLLTSPVPHFDLFKLETSLIRKNNKIKFKNFLLWPNNQILTLNLDILENHHEKTVEMQFNSPFNQPLTANLHYILNSEKIVFDLLCSIGKGEVTLQGIIIPQTYLTLMFTSPFSGYTTLNLTCSLDLSTQTSEIYFKKEDLITELKGDVSFGENKIYRINLIANNTQNNENINLAKVVVKIDTVGMKGEAEIFWKDDDVKVGYSYDPKDLMLEINTPFEIAQNIRLEGEYLNDVDLHNLQANGVWNRMVIGFHGLVFMGNDNFTVSSDINVGEDYKGVLDYSDSRDGHTREIRLKAYFPNENSKVTFKMDSENIKDGVKTKILLTTPFEMINSVSTESIIQNRYFDVLLQANLAQQILISTLESTFKNPSQFNVIFNLSVPQTGSKWDLEADFDIYEYGILKIDYETPTEANYMNFNYKVVDYKLESYIFVNGNHGKINNSLEVYFRSDSNERQYGFVLNNYKLIYKDNTWWYETHGWIEAKIPDYNIYFEANIDLDMLRRKSSVNCFFNHFRVHLDAIGTYYTFNATTTFEFNKRNVGNIYTEVEVLPDGFFIRNKAIDRERLWFNSSILYVNNHKLISLQTCTNRSLSESFKTNFYLSKSLNEVFADIQDTLNLDIQNKPTSSKLYLTFANKHKLKLDFKNTNFTLNIQSSFIKPEGLKLKLAWFSKNYNKHIIFDYFEQDKPVLNGIFNFNYTKEPLLLTINTYHYEKPLMEFSGKILISNVTQGSASLILHGEKHHAYFLLNPNDPYLVGFTVGTSFLPNGGITFETQTSVESSTLFIFAGTGPSDLLDKGFIELESHEKYILFEARRDNKQIFVKYEAPTMAWLKLIDLQAELDTDNNNLKFFETFRLESEISHNIALNTKLYISESGLESKIDFLLPFITVLNEFNAELVIPFQLSNKFNPKVLVKFPNTTYSAHLSYQREQDHFVISGGYQCATRILNIFFHLIINPLTTISVELNLPYGEYNHYALSLKRPKDFSTGHETSCYIDMFNTRIDLNYVIVFRRDRQLIKAILITPLEFYEKFSVNLEHQNGQERTLKALIYYPALKQEYGFDFGLAYRSMKEFKLDTKISLPMEIKGFLFGEFTINHKFQEKNKTYALSCSTKINNFNVSLDLETALNSNLILFYLDSKVGKNRFYTNAKSEGDMFNTINSLFEIETPLTIIKNAKLYLNSSLDLSRGIHGGILYNSKYYLQTDLVLKSGEMYFKLDNIWKPLLLEYKYFQTDYLYAFGKICWDLNHSNVSQFGGHFTFGRNFSAGLILPTRVVSVDTKYFIDKHNEYYFGRISWYKDKEVAAELSFKNYSLDNKIYLQSAAIITLPFRNVEIIDEVEADFQKSPTVKSKFTFKWDKNDFSKITLQNSVLPGKYESRLFMPILEHEIILKIDMSALSKIPSYMKAQLEYSNDTRKRIDFEMYYDKVLTDILQTERKFVLKHPASKVDYTLHFSTTRTPEFTTGNISLLYTNYLLNKREEIRSSLKIGHEKFEVAGEIQTNKNYLSISGVTKPGINFQGFLMNVQLNKKDPLLVEGMYNFKQTGSSVSLSSSYGNSRRYDFYAGLPSKREITVKLLHKMYDKETTDGLFTLRLNSSQILWMKLNWKNELLPQFQNAILEEYSDMRYIIEETGQQLIDVIDDEFGQNLINDVLGLQKKVSSYATQETNLLKTDYNKFLVDVEEGYKSNAFYYKDIERKTRKLFPNVTALKTTLLNPILEFLELLYKGIFETLHDIFASLEKLCYIIQAQAEHTIREVQDVKKLKAQAKEILKSGINEARESLKQMDILVAELMDSMDGHVAKFKEQCEEFFEPYLKLLDDLVIYVEQRLAILQMLVLDILDTIQHYILNLRESREVLKVYVLYLNWLEEFHITDILEPIADVIEAILDTIITDIKKVMNDYKPYIHAVSEAIFGNYQDLKDLPPLTEIREMFNKMYQRTLWIWNYHNLSEAMRSCFHKIMSDFDDYLASLIKFDDDYNDFENVLGQSDYIFRPDMGVIEITQPLPVEWEAFDEMPYFEQHPLYHKIKKRVEGLIQIQRHHFNDIFNVIKSYIGESSDVLLSPPTNNIAMVIGKSHYITFDKKYYSFSGECSYLLASDFVTNTFSVIINYELNQTITKKKSITIISDKNNLEIFTNFVIKLNNAEVDLPLIIGSLVVIRDNSEIIVENSRGLKVVCNLYYDYCSVELSGWLFGKTGGLLGTLDNEKVTDMSLPDGDRTSDVLEFVQSWQVGVSRNCSNVNHANDTLKTNLSPLTTTLFETLCQVFFINANSPLGNCFSSVDPKPFYDICVDNMKKIVNPTMCSAVAAYKAQCEKRNIAVDMPEMCVHCKYGINLNEDIFDRDNPKSIDVVMIRENSCFNSNYNFSFSQEINLALENEAFKDNRFATVGYDGSTDKPFIYTSKGQIWNTAENAAVNAKMISSGDSQQTVSGIDAIEFASNLEFRPGIFKLFILMHCDYRTELDNLNNLHNLFGEKDIVLHVLNTKTFDHHGEQLLELDSKGHVLYVQQGFNLQDSNMKTMNTTISELAPDQITDVYSLLALSTNGTVFSVDNEINHSRELILSSWAKVISQTAKRSPCQRCKCVATPDGTGKVECTRCMSPIVKQLLNEYESNIMEFHSSQDSEEYL